MKQKLSHSLSIFIIFLGLFFIGLSFSMAQADESAAVQSESSTPRPTPSAKPAPTDDLDPNGLDKASDDLKNNHKALETLMGELTKGEKPKTKIVKKDYDKTILDQEDAIKELAMKINNTMTPDKMKKMKIHQAVEVALAPLQGLSEKELMVKLKENVAGTNAQQIFEAAPLVTLFCVRLIKDPKAMSDMSRILEDRGVLVKFIAVMISTILIGFFLKRFFENKDRPFHKEIFYFFLRVFIMILIRLYVVYFFFADELDRAFTIFFKTFIN